MSSDPAKPGPVPPAAAEAALRESEERYRDLFENANDIIYTLDLEGRITSINKRAEQAFGYTPPECLGRPVAELIPPEFHARMADAFERKLAGEPTPTTYELELIAKGGRRVPLEISSRLIVRDGRPVGVQGIARDITERRRAEAERERLLRQVEAERAFLKQAEEAQRFLAQAGEVLADSLDYEVTLQQVARLAVPALADWCSVDVVHDDQTVRRVAIVHPDPEKVALGQELLRRYPPGLDTAEGGVMRSGEAMLIPEIGDVHLTAYARDADHLDVIRGLGLKSTMVVPLVAHGRILGCISLVAAESGRHYGPTDLALAQELARRAALAVANALLYRELRESDRRKDEFLAMLAHELRNPLAPIRNALHILKLPGVDGRQVGQVREMMERQVEHLVRMVDDLLDVSRVMRGKVELRQEPIDLLAVLARAVETAQPVLDAHGHQLTVALPPAPVPVQGDLVRLAQVFANLLHNAAKYTERAGRIELTAATEAGEVVVRVRDNGVGIGPELLPRVFDLFVQGDRSAARTQGGLGIGLTLVRRLVEMHGGRVTAASEGPGCGSEFVVRLPLLPTGGTPEEVGASGDTDSAKAARSRVLVVDDNVDAAASLALLLRVTGHEVRTAHDGREALDAARAFRPQAVVLDIGLPGMDGYEVARRLRQEPAVEKALLVAVTGYGQEEDHRRSREAGLDHHLVKPVDPRELEALLCAGRQGE